MLSAQDQQAVRRWQNEQRAIEALGSEELDLDLLNAEAETAYREAAKHFMRIFNSAMVYILSDSRPLLAGWKVAYALGLPVCAGVSEEDRATEIGCGRAAISQGAKLFRRSQGLPPSEHERDSTKACADARVKQLTQ